MQNLPTPIKVGELQDLLRGYDPVKAKYLIDGFTVGFRLGCKEFVTSQASKNAFTVQSNVIAARDLIQAELDSGRVAGPFKQAPFSNFHVSPLGLREKSTPGRYRLIHDLSYPYTKDSVNGSIPRDLASVSYADVQTAIQYIIQLGQGSYLSKVDIKSAFRLVPVHPDDYHLLGFTFQGEFYYDRCLAMGCSSSCAIFESFSSALEWAMKNRLGVLQCTHMIDDFLIVEKTKGDCAWSLKTFEIVCKRLGVPFAPEKTVGPETSLTFLGVQLCTQKMLAYLPEDKLWKYAEDIESLLQNKVCRVKDIQRLAGKLNWASAVVTPGRTFNRRLFNAICGVKNPVHFVTISEGIKADLKMWMEFFQTHNGKSFIARRKLLTSEDLQLYTDASSQGAGVVFGTQWQQIIFPASWKKINIAILELYPIVVAVATFHDAMVGKHVVFHSDNQAVVCVLRTKTAKDTSIMLLVRKLVLLCLRYDIIFDSVHIPGKVNFLPDAISRFQNVDKQLVEKGMQLEPVEVPQEWQPRNFSWSEKN